ncbi:glycosyltransferase [Candidatus Calescamantes bacterium]|nr:glycosyltransferase [Candidatus Calescamantes bacterium]
MIGIGISTRNCEDTIAEVIKIVDEGVTKYFPQQKSLIIVCDGFSEDRTMEVAQDTVTKTEKIVVTQRGGPGKGNGVKNIFQLSLERNCENLALIDGDLLSITPDWLKNLLYPLKEGVDLVIPYYFRHPFDGVITNNIAYPLTTCLYGKEVRQPIGGEFSLSQRLIKRLLRHPLFPGDFGIDIFLTTVALAEDFKVIESVLGRKEHTSTSLYNSPELSLFPMYHQVVRELFELYLYYEEKVKTVSEIKKIPRYGRVSPDTMTSSMQIDVKRWQEILWRDYAKLYLPSPLKEVFSPWQREIEKVFSSKETIYLSIPLWAKILFQSLLNYRLNKEEILNILRIFWEARYVSLLQEGKELTPEEIEKKILSQVQIFWGERKFFL